MARLARKSQSELILKKDSIKIVKRKKSVSYENYLIASLQDPEEAAGYLNAALKGGDIDVFLVALQNVVQARGGIAVLAEKANKSRTSLYKSLSAKGNPSLKSTNEMLMAMGMHLVVFSEAHALRKKTRPIARSTLKTRAVL